MEFARSTSTPDETLRIFAEAVRQSIQTMDLRRVCDILWMYCQEKANGETNADTHAREALTQERLNRSLRAWARYFGFRN